MPPSKIIIFVNPREQQAYGVIGQADHVPVILAEDVEAAE
jgi:hypothetical protein